jgi:hypothetical protein
MKKLARSHKSLPLQFVSPPFPQVSYLHPNSINWLHQLTIFTAKALELFMISLVTKSASVAKTSSSKRVTAQHLKKAIEADEQFDFLNEIVSRVVEGPDAGGKRVKSEEGSDDDMDVDGGKGRGGAGAAKKAKGRRKKGE